MRAFAAIHDPAGRGATPEDEQRVAEALDAADGSTRLGSLALAWRGAAAPVEASGRLAFLDGCLWEPVALAAIAARHEREGDRLFERLRGDFAILVYDPARDVFVAGRDHMGGRGLFWHLAGRRLCVASEVRFLLPLLDRMPEPDPVSLANLLGPGGPKVDATVYDGVRRVVAGHVLEARPSSVTTRRHWQLTYRAPVERPRQEHVDGLRAALDTAVRRRADGATTGVLLSGGLDSSTVAAIGSTLGDRRPRRAYSATFPRHPSIDETELITTTTEAFELAWTRVDVQRGSVASGALEYIEHWRLPPPSPNLFFWFPLLRQVAADGVGVLLDGEGGDELFGLSPYLVADRVRRLDPKGAARLIRAFPGGGDHVSRRQVWPFFVRLGLRGALPPVVDGTFRRWFRRDRVPAWLRPPLREAFLRNDPENEWKRFDGPRWWRFLVSMVTSGTGNALMYDHVRRRGALAGVENRHPLVDVDVIHHVLSIPPELAYDTTRTRPLQRDATAGLLPDPVRTRIGKSTFDAVFHEALAGPDLGVARQILRPGHCRVEEHVDLTVVARELLDRPPPPEERNAWAQAVWRLVTAELWLRVRAGDRIDLELAPADLRIIGP